MQVKIDWMDGFCNDPTFQVSDVTMPDWPAEQLPAWEQWRQAVRDMGAADAASDSPRSMT